MDNLEKNNTINELYKKLLPALNTKLDELRREKIYNIDTLDIWKYCIENIWKKRKSLRVYELVDDILNVDGLSISKYFKNK